MKVNKTTISKFFKKNLERYGLIVKNLQSNRAMGKGTTGLPDIIVIGDKRRGDLYFIEIKIGNDKISPEQERVLSYLFKCTNHVYIATEDNYQEILIDILYKHNQNQYEKRAVDNSDKLIYRGDSS